MPEVDTESPVSGGGPAESASALGRGANPSQGSPPVLPYAVAGGYGPLGLRRRFPYGQWIGAAVLCIINGAVLWGAVCTLQSMQEWLDVPQANLEVPKEIFYIPVLSVEAVEGAVLVLTIAVAFAALPRVPVLIRIALTAMPVYPIVVGLWLLSRLL